MQATAEPHRGRYIVGWARGRLSGTCPPSVAPVPAAGARAGGPHVTVVAHDPTPGRRPIGRAIAIVEILADATAPLRLTEVARRSGLPKTTTARLVEHLVEAGMAVRVRDRFAPGPRLLALADRVADDGHGRLSRLM